MGTPRTTDVQRTARSLVLMLSGVFVLLATPSSFGADKSGVSLNSISLPSGAGSIEGLGESFQPTLNTGTAKYGVALTLPPGTAGLTPDLGLAYDGGGSNGPLGYGWHLKVPYVQRQTDKGIPLYVDAADGIDNDNDGTIDEADEVDVFITDSSEELVPVESTPGGPLDYFCENESSFIRYRRVGDGWEATLPNGTRMELGTTAQARVQSSTSGTTPVTYIFAWMPERIVDTNGNAIQFTYRTFPGSENLNQIYISKIEYGPGGGPWTNFHFVTFLYDTDGEGAALPREDWFEDCRAGFPVRTGVRLSEILVATQGPQFSNHAAGDFNGDTITDYLNRRYSLKYESDPYWSLLSSLTQYGADDVSSLPPATFDYTNCDYATVKSAADAYIVSSNAPTAIPGDTYSDFVDLNGDGLPDLLETTEPTGFNYHRAYLNLGEDTTGGHPAIRWSDELIQQSFDGFAWGVNLSSETEIASLSDMTGDGVADLVYKSLAGDIYYYENVGGLLWGPEKKMFIEDFAPPAPFGSPDVKTADLDFDKNIDIIESSLAAGSIEYDIWFNQGDQRYSKMTTRLQPIGTGALFQDQGVEIADFNGDRVPDISAIENDGVQVSAGLGYGNFLPARLVALPDYLLTTTDLQYAKLRDITGDGLPELIIERAGSGTELWYWTNRGNYTFDVLRKITGMPEDAGPGAEVRWADMNGNGTTDYVYCDQSFGGTMTTVDLGRILGCTPKARLLKTITNGIGRVTHIGYDTSTTFLLADGGWNDPLPFPVTVVANVTTEDSLGNSYLTRFRYHQGYYDGLEKEFRGFARVEQIEVGDDPSSPNFSAPTLVTQNFFDTGRDYEALKGKLLRQVAQVEDPLAVQSPDDTSLTFTDEVTTLTRPPVTLYTGTDGKQVSFAHPVDTQRDTRERQPGPPGELGAGPVRTRSEYQYDNYGNQLVNANYGLVLGSDFSYQDDEQVTVNAYAINEDKWIIHALARQELMDEVAYNSWRANGTVTAGQVVARTETFYDDPTFAGDNWGAVSIGRTTMIRTWTDTSSPTAYIIAGRTQYDDYGNPESFLDPLASAPDGNIDEAIGHFRTVVYDTDFNSYPLSETIHLENGKTALSVSAAYDKGFGTISLSIDFNGNETRYSYDTFRRLSNIVRPGDDDTFPTAEYDYHLAESVGLGKTLNFVETRMLDKAQGSLPGGATHRDYYLITRAYVDGLGRTLMTKSEAEPDPQNGNPRVVAGAAARFNLRRVASSTLQPFYSLVSGSLDAQLAYEDIRAGGWSGEFHDSGTLVTLDLANAQVSYSEYDALLRGVRAINPDGTYALTEYNPLFTKSFDENDNEIASPYADTPMVHYNDGLGRLVRVDEIAKLNDDGTPTAPDDKRTWITRYAYRLDGVLERITDSQDNQKTMRYDALQRMTFMDDPDRGILRYQYDSASNVIQTVDAKQQVIRLTYDGANRILTQDYLDDGAPVSYGHSYNPLQPISRENRPDVAYFYDLPAGPILLGHNDTPEAQQTKGALAYVWDTSGEEHYSFDSRGRLTWTVKQIPDPETGVLVPYQTKMAYDAMDRLTTLTYPDGDRVNHIYNDRALLEQITGGALHNRNATPYILAGLEYTPSGQRLESLFGNGVTTTHAYDKRTRLTRLQTLAPDSTPYLDYTYDFDPASNINAIHDVRPVSVHPPGDPLRNTQLFQYDDLYRLTRVGYSHAAPGPAPVEEKHIAYRYDRIGNMLTMTSDIEHEERGVTVTNPGEMDYGGTAGAHDRTGRGEAPGADPGPHALTSTGLGGARQFTYDPNGNMETLDGLACSWDFADRLRFAENSDMRAEYTYDHTGRRITKKVWIKKEGNSPSPLSKPNLATEYINRYFEVREYDQPIKYVWNGDTRVASVSGTLDPDADRIQHVRLRQGWNLFAILVDATDTANQIGIGADPNITAALRWDRDTRTYLPVSPGDPLPASVILWLQASAHTNLALRGIRPQSDTLEIAPGGDLAASPALEATPIAPWREDLGDAFTYDPITARWQPIASTILGQALQSPQCVPPGHVLFALTSTEQQIQTSQTNEQIQYFHGDHLQSTNAISNAHGDLNEEHTFYPFGDVRNTLAMQEDYICSSSNYRFTQKEKDLESQFIYFESRYFVTTICRFLRVDPYAETIQKSAFRDPQRWNSYSYCHNSPLVFHDPQGTAEIETSLSSSGLVKGGFGLECGPEGLATLKTMGTFSGDTDGNSIVCSETSADLLGILKGGFDACWNMATGETFTKKSGTLADDTMGNGESKSHSMSIKEEQDKTTVCYKFDTAKKWKDGEKDTSSLEVCLATSKDGTKADLSVKGSGSISLEAKTPLPNLPGCRLVTSVSGQGSITGKLSISGLPSTEKSSSTITPEQQRQFEQYMNTRGTSTLP